MQEGNLFRLLIADCRLPIGFYYRDSMKNKSAIGNAFSFHRLFPQARKYFIENIFWLTT